jgi:hypothetical protein
MSWIAELAAISRLILLRRLAIACKSVKDTEARIDTPVTGAKIPGGSGELHQTLASRRTGFGLVKLLKRRESGEHLQTAYKVVPVDVIPIITICIATNAQPSAQGVSYSPHIWIAKKLNY